MNEVIAVEARFEIDGAIHPLAFSWRGKRYRVVSLGRRWEEGEARHFLVMTPEEQIYELAYLLEESRWILRRTPKDFRPPRRMA
jgi:hypothetical protein